MPGPLDSVVSSSPEGRPSGWILEASSRVDARRRRVYQWVALGACLSQLVSLILLELTAHPSSSAVMGTAFGTVLCGVLAWTLYQRHIPLIWVDYAALVGASVAVGSQLVSAFATPTPPEPRLYFIGLFLFIAAFSVLPAARAIVFALVLYTLFVVLALTRPPPLDLSLLIQQGLAAALVGHLSIFGRQISVERAEASMFRRMALTDPLTGADNRRAMLDRLNQACTTPQAERRFAAVLIDIDFFKRVNDTYGHDVGDQVLQHVAQLLQQHMQDGEHVARWGGEEFMVLLQDVDRAGVHQATERLWWAVRSSEVLGLLGTTASFGVAHGTEADHLGDLIQLADARLYTAKERGRDQVASSETDDVHT